MFADDRQHQERRLYFGANDTGVLDAVADFQVAKAGINHRSADGIGLEQDERLRRVPAGYLRAASRSRAWMRSDS